MKLVVVVIGLMSAACDAVFLDERACDAVGNDEDGDELDDGCDPCPHVSATGHRDGDGDGVGDDCDPRPDIAGETMLFDGLHAVRTYGEFRATRNLPDGTAVFGPGDAFLIDTAATTYRVEVAFQVDEVQDFESYMGFAHGASLGTGTRYNGFWCFAGRHTPSGPDDYLEFLLQAPGDPMNGRIGNRDYTADLEGYSGLDGTWTAEVTATSMRCAVARNGAPLASLAKPRLLEPAGIGFYSHMSAIRIDYILVITTPE